MKTNPMIDISDLEEGESSSPGSSNSLVERIDVN